MRKHLHQSGFAVVIAAVVVLLVAVGATIFIMSKKGSDNKTQDASVTKTSNGEEGPSISENQRLSQNVERKNDAQNVAAGVAEFISNNTGTLPSGWQNGEITGANGAMPSQVQLSHYSAVTFADAQASGNVAAVTGDTVRVVTHADCGSNGSAKVSESSRSYALQYSQATNKGGSFVGECFEE